MCSLLIFDYHTWNECYFDVYKLMGDVYYIIRYRGISGWTLDKLHKVAVGILLKSQQWILLSTMLLSYTYGIYNCENSLKCTLIKKLNWSLAEQFSGEVKSSTYVGMWSFNKNHSTLTRNIQCITTKNKSVVLVSCILRSSMKNSVIF